MKGAVLNGLEGIVNADKFGEARTTVIELLVVTGALAPPALVATT